MQVIVHCERGRAGTVSIQQEMRASKFRLGQRRALILAKVVVAVGGCLCCDQGRESDRARSSRCESLSSVEKEVNERPGCCRSCSIDGIARLDHVPASTKDGRKDRQLNQLREPDRRSYNKRQSAEQDCRS